MGTTKTNGVPLWLASTNEDSLHLKCSATMRTNGDLPPHGPTPYTDRHFHGVERFIKSEDRAGGNDAGSSISTQSIRPGHGTITHGCPLERSPSLVDNCHTNITLRSFGQILRTSPCHHQRTTPGQPTFDALRAPRTAARAQATATFQICWQAHATHRHRQNPI